jgi:hypothetical protein
VVVLKNAGVLNTKNENVLFPSGLAINLR